MSVLEGEKIEGYVQQMNLQKGKMVTTKIDHDISEI